MTRIIRQVARSVLTTPSQKVLLIGIELPWIPGPAVWTLPGGGIDDGESSEACMRRETFEETGLDLQTPTKEVWRTTYDFVFQGKPRQSNEQYFHAPTDDFEPTLDNMLDYELEWAPRFRWWHIDELRTTTEKFSPGPLPGLVIDLMEGRVPDQPIQIANPMPKGYVPA